jgi:hypothetical protein
MWTFVFHFLFLAFFLKKDNHLVYTCAGGLLQVDLECEDGKKAIGIYSHKMLSV